MKEFQLIEELLAPLAGEGAPAFGLTDDAAVLSLPLGGDTGAALGVALGEALVLTKDLMVAGVHFPFNEDGAAVARKLLRVNLSDLAAMGARPIGYLVGFAGTKDLPQQWVRSFVAGLEKDQQAYEVKLLGGDTVSGSQTLVLSLTAVGAVPEGTALRRSGAAAGDGIFVSGTLGDGALGLKCLRGDLVAAKDMADYLLRRYRLPEPRLALGVALRGLATSCIDVSDGLVADMGHIAKTSECRAVLNRTDLPLSEPARTLVESETHLWECIWAGGDDYELLFTAALDRRADIAKIADELGLSVSLIGQMKSGDGVELRNENGQPVDIGNGGYQHNVTG